MINRWHQRTSARWTYQKARPLSKSGQTYSVSAYAVLSRGREHKQARERRPPSRSATAYGPAWTCTPSNVSAVSVVSHRTCICTSTSLRFQVGEFCESWLANTDWFLATLVGKRKSRPVSQAARGQRKGATRALLLKTCVCSQPASPLRGRQVRPPPPPRPQLIGLTLPNRMRFFSNMSDTPIIVSKIDPARA